MLAWFRSGRFAADKKPLRVPWYVWWKKRNTPQLWMCVACTILIIFILSVIAYRVYQYRKLLNKSIQQKKILPVPAPVATMNK